MKKDEDSKIQELLDQKMQGKGNVAPEMMDKDDLRAYELLYDHLKEKPGQGLSLSFKPNVLRQIAIEKKQADDSKFYWLLGFVFLFGIIVITSLAFVFKDVFVPSMSVIDKYKGFIIIGIAAVVLFNIVENRLTKTKFDSVP